MKLRYKILLLFLLLLSGAVFAGSQFEPVKAATRKIVYNLRFQDGLVAYWSFDGKDMSGTTATDGSGNGNSGTLVGPTAIPGVIGQALNFDGSNDYINAGSAGSTLTDNFTITAWVKGSVVNKRIVARRTGAGGTQWEIYADSGTGVLSLYDGTAERKSSTIITDGAWHFIATVVNGSASQHYVDGSASGSTFTPSITTKVLNTGIGGWSDGSVLWNGVIDEPRIYNRALSAAEVAYQYERTKPAGAGTVAKSTGNNNGLSGYWDFDDCDTCTTVTDRSGNGNTGTMYNAAGPTAGDLHTASGRIGRGANFDGTNDYISAPDSSSFAFTGNIVTLAAWIKADTSGNGTQRSVFSQYNGGVEGGILLYLTTGNKLNYHDGSSGNVATNATFTDGSWHYVVYVSQSNVSHQLYVDGILDKNDTSTALVLNSTQPMQIGADLSLGVAAVFFKGQIDEARVYNRALSAAEVKNLYDSTRKMFVNMPQNNLLTDGLVGYWSFNGKDMSGTTAYDRSGSGNNGTLTSGPTVTPGIVGQALDFDGSNDWVSAGDPASGVLDFGASQDFSYSAWFKTDNTAATGVVLAKNLASSGPGYGSRVSTTATCWVGNGTSTVEPGGGTIIAGNWHFLTCTRSGATVTTYVDGISVNTGSMSSDLSSANGLEFGSRNLGNTQFLNGSIDEVRIYNRALSAGEVKQLYDAGKR